MTIGIHTSCAGIWKILEDYKEENKSHLQSYSELITTINILIYPLSLFVKV